MDPAYEDVPLLGLDLYTRRRYLILKACEGGAAFWAASEAVASTALAHGWDLTEERTWDEWEAEA